MHFLLKFLRLSIVLATFPLMGQVDSTSTEAQPYRMLIAVDSSYADDRIDDLRSQGHIYFIMHGIDSSIPVEYVRFREKYGVGLYKENCVVDPFSAERAHKNNQRLSAYLNQKYGKGWQGELKSKPFGLTDSLRRF